MKGPKANFARQASFGKLLCGNLPESSLHLLGCLKSVAIHREHRDRMAKVTFQHGSVSQNHRRIEPCLNVHLAALIRGAHPKIPLQVGTMPCTSMVPHFWNPEPSSRYE